jgi:FSR family fosmidomycin resistance protein-like MFS transporter
MQLTHDAPQAVPAPRLWLGLGLAATAHFANDAVTGMFPALLPALAAKFRLEPGDIALLASALAITTSLPQPIFGLLADRLGRNRVGAIGLGVSAALLLGVSLVSSAAWLWALLLVGGLGSSALHPAGMGLARAASPNNGGLGVALFSSAGMAGGAVGPLLAIGITSAWGLSELAWAALPILCLAAWLGHGESPGVAARQVSPIRLARDLLKGPTGWLALVALLANLVMLSFTSAIPIWLVAERGFGETSAVIGLTLGSLSLGAAVGGVLGGALARRQEPDRLIVGSLALSLFALEGILLTAPGSALYLCLVAAAGALLGLSSPVLIAKAQELRPGSESAVAGLMLGGTWAAAGVIYAVLGTAQSEIGIGNTLAGVALLVLPAAHLAKITLRPTLPKATSGCAVACSHDTGCCAELAA